MKKVLLVKDVMIKNVIVVPEEISVKEAIKVFYQNNFSGGPVVNNDGKIIGVISEKDLFGALYPTYHDIEHGELSSLSDPEKMEEWLETSGDKKVNEIMNRKVISVTTETPLVNAGAIMIAERIHRLPVFEDGKLVGIISRRDLYRAIFNHLFNLE